MYRLSVLFLAFAGDLLVFIPISHPLVQICKHVVLLLLLAFLQGSIPIPFVYLLLLGLRVRSGIESLIAAVRIIAIDIDCVAFCGIARVLPNSSASRTASSSGASGARAEGLRVSKRAFFDVGDVGWWLRANSSPPRFGRAMAGRPAILRNHLVQIMVILIGSGTLFIYVDYPSCRFEDHLNIAWAHGGAAEVAVGLRHL